MAGAKEKDRVKVHYKGMLDDGSVFDSSEGREPLEFTMGAGMMIPGFEAAVSGMNVGEKKTVKIPCMEAYGPIHPEGINEIPRDGFPPDIDLKPGLQLQLSDKEGGIIIVTVTKVTDKSVTIDANHPLAGRDLTFEIELVSIN
ncbi:MAG TPA: peptidylprolyl isomerase [Candidatus Goldiibacteriota bacterium]|nr:peptidylprolyl isomerase [Candidatus Goldiibacteriota bacterium]